MVSILSIDYFGATKLVTWLIYLSQMESVLQQLYHKKIIGIYNRAASDHQQDMHINGIESQSRKHTFKFIQPENQMY